MNKLNKTFFRRLNETLLARNQKEKELSEWDNTAFNQPFMKVPIFHWLHIYNMRATVGIVAFACDEFDEDIKLHEALSLIEQNIDRLESMGDIEGLESPFTDDARRWCLDIAYEAFGTKRGG